MAIKKANTLPEYKNPPPPPAPKNSVKSNEETCVEVLTAIRQHTPEQQNWILREVLKETAFERHNQMKAIQEDLLRSESNFKEFMDLQHTGERALNEIDQKKGR